MLLLNLCSFILIQLSFTFAYFSKWRLSYIASLFVLVLLSLMIGSRLIGYDLNSYSYIYRGIISGDIVRSIEPTVEYIAWTAHAIGLDYFGFMLIYSIITFLLLIFVSKLYKLNLYSSVCLYVVFFLASGPMVSVRASVAALFILISFVYLFRSNKIIFVSCVACAVFFHYSSVFCIPILFAYYFFNKISDRLMFTSSLSAFIIAMILIFAETFNSYGIGIYFPYVEQKILSYIYDVVVDPFNIAHMSLVLRQLVVSVAVIYILNQVVKYHMVVDGLHRFIFFCISLVSFLSIFSLFLNFSVLGARLFELLSVGIIVIICYYRVNIFYPLLLVSLANAGYMYLGYMSILLDLVRL